jgi:hypothetical protein
MAGARGGSGLLAPLPALPVARPRVGAAVGGGVAVSDGDDDGALDALLGVDVPEPAPAATALAGHKVRCDAAVVRGMMHLHTATAAVSDRTALAPAPSDG